METNTDCSLESRNEFKRNKYMDWFSANHIEAGDPLEITEAFVKANRMKLAKVLQENHINNAENGMTKQNRK